METLKNKIKEAWERKYLSLYILRMGGIGFSFAIIQTSFFPWVLFFSSFLSFLGIIIGTIKNA